MFQCSKKYNNETYKGIYSIRINQGKTTQKSLNAVVCFPSKLAIQEKATQGYNSTQKKEEAKARLNQDKAIACKATGIVEASKSSHITKNNKRQAKKSQHKA